MFIPVVYPIIPDLKSNVIESYSNLLNNALAGQPISNFSQALLQPESLSPEERKKLSARLGLKGPYKILMDTATNPMVVIGAALSFLYPVSAAGKTFGRNLTPDSYKIIKQLGPLESLLATPDQIYKNYPQVAHHLNKLQAEIFHTGHKWGSELSEAIATASKIKGSHFNKQDKWLATRIMEGGMDINSTHNKLIKGIIKDASLENATLVSAGRFANLKPNHRKAIETFVEMERKSYLNAWKQAGEKLSAELVKRSERLGLDPSALIDTIESNSKRGAFKIKLGAFKKDYFPHVVKHESQLLTSMASSEQEFNKILERRMGTVGVPSNLRYRDAAPLPDWKELEEIQEFLDPKMYNAIKAKQLEAPKVFKEKLLGILNATAHEDFSVWQKNFHTKAKELFIQDYHLKENIASSQAANFVHEMGSAPDVFRKGVTTHSFDSLLRKRAETIGAYRTYTIDPEAAKTAYIRSMAGPVIMDTKRVMSVNAEPQTYRDWFLDAAKEMKSGNDMVRADMLMQEYLPLAYGSKTFKQFKNTNLFNGFKINAIDKLRDESIVKFMDATPVGKKTREKLIDFISGSGSPLNTPGEIANAVSTMMYHGALAYNPVSAGQNMFQIITTLSSKLGIKPVAMGYKKVMAKSGGFMKELTAGYKKGLSYSDSMDKALQKYYPEFAKYEMQGSSQYMDFELKKSLNDNMLRRAYDKITDTGMAGFLSTEVHNRLVSWEAAIYHAKNDKNFMRTVFETGSMKRGERVHQKLAEYASQVVRETQFSGGKLSTPRMMRNVPSPFRQFTSYPLRYAGFISNSLNENGKFYGGTLGRAMLGSGIAYEAMKGVAGVDVSQALLTGSMPTPSEYGPFAPYPFVTPTMDIIGTGVQAAMGKRGASDRLKRSMSLTIPGGGAGSRAFKYVSPTRADYSQYASTGKVPVYDKDGSLISRYTMPQLIAKAAGIKTWSNTQEQEAVRMLLSQKEQMAAMRSEYMNAIAANDYKTMEQLKQEWEDKWPGMGGLQVKRSDMELLYKRREMSKLERTLKMFSKDQREALAPMVGLARSQVDTQTILTNPNMPY